MPDLLPYVCIPCRRSFKRPGCFAPPSRRPCPSCGAPAICLHHTFKVPPSSDVKQWAKVAFLIERGFRFIPIWDARTQRKVRYPETLSEARRFAETWKEHATRHGQAREYGVPADFQMSLDQAMKTAHAIVFAVHAEAPGLENFRVTPELHGIFQISGAAPTGKLKQRAELAARGVNGVERLISKIKVKRGRAPAAS